jgi:sec-independent protein translocase protein TatA
MGNIGATELILIILVALLLFGAGRVADIGKGLGEGIRNFKKGLSDDDKGKAPKADDKEAKLGEPPVVATLPAAEPAPAKAKAADEAPARADS